MYLSTSEWLYMQWWIQLSDYAVYIGSTIDIGPCLDIVVLEERGSHTAFDEYFLN